MADEMHLCEGTLPPTPNPPTKKQGHRRTRHVRLKEYGNDMTVARQKKERRETSYRD